VNILRVAAAGLLDPPRDMDDALAAAEHSIATAAAAGVRLLVLPQRLLAGRESEARGILSDAPPLRALGEAARLHAVAVACGYLEHCSGRLHDAALFIDERGRALANYRRTHLDALRDPDELAPGHWLNLVAFGGTRLGLMIGPDLEAPELARALALAGAAILLVPARWGPQGGAMTEALLRARAFENGCGLLFANLDATADAPASLIVGPDGTVLAAAVAGLAIADLPLHRPEDGRRRLAARRPPLYQRLTVPLPPDEAPRS
jgi:predicted amidohydrolase